MTPEDLKHFAAVLAGSLTVEGYHRCKEALSASSATDDMGAAAKAMFEVVLSEHVACLDPPMFIRHRDKKLIAPKSFDLQYNRVVNLLPESVRSKKYHDKASLYASSGFVLRQALSAVYEPGQDDWIDTAFNMWRSPNIEPLAETPDIFLEHVNYLIPDERERGFLLDYFAWMVQHPDKKIMFALLIVGRGGTGKSWFGGLLQAMFGRDNVLLLPKGESAADRFNAEHANRQAIFVDELVPSEKLNLARAIAHMITQPTVWVEPKGINKFEVANRFNVVAVSNYPDAIKILRDDRRWLVIRATEDVRHTDDNNAPTAETVNYYNRLHGITPPDGTVTDEVRRIIWWLGQRSLSGFGGQSLAPQTETKNEVAELSESNILSQVQGLAEQQIGPFSYVLLTVPDVRARLHFAIDDRLTSKQINAQVAAAMEVVGCRRVSSEQAWLGKERVRFWVTHKRFIEPMAGKSPRELAEEYRFERELCPDDGVSADADADV